jgi:hypothetical protein
LASNIGDIRLLIHPLDNKTDWTTTDGGVPVDEIGMDGMQVVNKKIAGDAGGVVEGAEQGVHAGGSKDKGDDVDGLHEAKDDAPDVLSKHVCEVGPGCEGGIAEGDKEGDGIGDSNVVEDAKKMVARSRGPVRIRG